MTAEQLQKEIKGLWEIVNRLENTYNDDKRHFTIDGHLLGSIGEVYAKVMFKLELLPNSEKTHDAIDEKTGKKYQIKTTQGSRIALSSEPENLIVIVISKDNDGLPKIIYNGVGKLVWEKIKNQKSKQKFISINQLISLERLIKLS